MPQVGQEPTKHWSGKRRLIRLMLCHLSNKSAEEVKQKCFDYKAGCKKTHFSKCTKLCCKQPCTSITGKISLLGITPDGNVDGCLT